MKVYINWEEWRDFPCLYKEPAWTDEKPTEVPEELFSEYQSLVDRLETIIKEIDKLQEEQEESNG